MHAFVINLKHRVDRKEHVIQELQKLQNITYEFITAIEHVDPKIGCTLSHQYCINTAKQKNLEHVMILEDDVIFESNVMEVFENAWKHVQKYEWNLLYLGGNIKDIATHVDDHLLRVQSVNTTHAYIIHERFYDVILDLPSEPIIDYQYRKLNATYPMYMCAPMVAYQMPSYSDLQQQHVNYKDIMYKSYQRSVKK